MMAHQPTSSNPPAADDSSAEDGQQMHMHMQMEMERQGQLQQQQQQVPLLQGQHGEQQQLDEQRQHNASAAAAAEAVAVDEAEASAAAAVGVVERLAGKTQDIIMQARQETQDKLAEESNRQVVSSVQVLEAALAKLPAGTVQQALLSQVSSLASPKKDREEMLMTTTDNEERARHPISKSRYKDRWARLKSTKMMVECSPDGPWLLDGKRRWRPRVQCKDCERRFDLKPEDVPPSTANANANDFHNHCKKPCKKTCSRRSTSAPRPRFHEDDDLT